MNRIVANMPYHRLTGMIAYKASWEGIRVYAASEKDTSKTCHRCEAVGTSNKASSYPLAADNADLNGAINLAERFSEYALENGATFNMVHQTLGR